MPFKSKAQARYMFARHPEIAKEFSHATPSIASLPEHARKRKRPPVPDVRKLKQ